MLLLIKKEDSVRQKNKEHTTLKRNAVDEDVEAKTTGVTGAWTIRGWVYGCMGNVVG